MGKSLITRPGGGRAAERRPPAGQRLSRPTAINQISYLLRRYEKNPYYIRKHFLRLSVKNYYPITFATYAIRFSSNAQDSP